MNRMGGRKSASPAVWDRATVRHFRHRLLEWYRREKRTLPWRSDPDPYRVWISEIMLQQTQVRTVLPYYERFIERFPDMQTLASAPESEVLELWAGLGYYSRARNLRLAAQKIASELGGKFPDTREGLLQLPGIGRYTAGAIRSIAFHSPEPVVDGNVRRVIGRLYGARRKIPEQYFWTQAEALISRAHPSDFNQALMDLGALVCTYRRPACGDCPVQEYCLARRMGIEDQVPAARNARAYLAVELVLLVVQHADKVLVTSKSAGAYIPGPYGFPGRVLSRGVSPENAARNLIRKMLGSTVPLRSRAGIRHAITFRRITAHVFQADVSNGGLKAKDCRWVQRLEIDRFITSALYRKALNSANS